MKIRIESLDIFYYPDLSVTCNPNDRHKYFKKYPCLIVETLSPSTERVDRNEKLLNYRQLESLQEYVLISQDRPQIEIYRNQSQGKWHLEVLGYDDTLHLQSLGLEMTVAQIYEDVDFESVGSE